MINDSIQETAVKIVRLFSVRQVIKFEWDSQMRTNYAALRTIKTDLRRMLTSTLGLKCCRCRVSNIADTQSMTIWQHGDGLVIEYLRNYKNAKQILQKSRTNFNSMSAAVLFIPDQSEIVHIEQADYRKSNHFYQNPKLVLPVLFPVVLPVIF